MQVVEENRPVVVDNNQSNLPSVDYWPIILGSDSLATLFFTHVKNVPYLLDLKKNTLNDHISSRISYGETAVMSFTSAAYNAVFAITSLFLVVVTCGSQKEINYACKKHLIRSALAYNCFAMGLLGVISPKLSFTASGITIGGAFALFAGKLKGELEGAAGGVTQRVRNLWAQNRPQLEQRVQQVVQGVTRQQGNESNAQETVGSLFNLVDRLLGQVQTLGDLRNLPRDILAGMPAEVSHAVEEN